VHVITVVDGMFMYYHIVLSIQSHIYVLSGAFFSHKCLQCFDTVGWAAGRASGLQKTQWWGAGVVVCLEQGA